MTRSEREKTRKAMLEVALVTERNARTLERAGLGLGARLLRERAERERKLADSLVAGQHGYERMEA